MINQETSKIVCCLVVSGISKAVCDTIRYHWDRSKFNKIRNKRIWIWFKSDYENRPNHPVWFLWDAWHFFNSLMLYSLLFAFNSWWMALIWAVVIGIVFTIFFHKFFIATYFPK